VTLRTVHVVGYGVMGRAVSGTFAAAGFETTVVSRRAEGLADVPRGVRVASPWPKTPADLVLEFVPEDVAIKQAVFAALEANYPASTLLATGTSGLDLIELGARLTAPERFVGVHYFMPAESTAVAEVMAGPRAPVATVDRVAAAVRATGKEVVVLYRPTVGFLINRLQHAILHEAYWLIQEGISSAADIDRAARRMLGPRMCLNGLIEQKDISGLAIHASAQRSIVPTLHPHIPSALLQGMVGRGETGLDAGLGFYDWSLCELRATRNQAARRLEKLTRWLEAEAADTAPNTTPRLRSPETAR
jgi:3-hydroxybutyryl-CoA dehydrogenase